MFISIMLLSAASANMSLPSQSLPLPLGSWLPPLGWFCCVSFSLAVAYDFVLFGSTVMPGRTLGYCLFFVIVFTLLMGLPLFVPVALDFTWFERELQWVYPVSLSKV